MRAGSNGMQIRYNLDGRLSGTLLGLRSLLHMTTSAQYSDLHVIFGYLAKRQNRIRNMEQYLRQFNFKCSSVNNFNNCKQKLFSFARLFIWIYIAYFNRFIKVLHVCPR